MKLFIAGLALCCSALTAAVKVPGFLARRDYPSAGGFVALGDVTGDGIPDIVAVAAQDTVSTMLGNGNGSFGNAVNTTVQWMNMSGAALADLNGDGKADLVIGGSPEAVGDGGIGVLLSNGDGTFPQPVFYKVNDGALGNAVAGDFNGDGILDIAAGGTKGIWLFEGKGDGTFHAGFLAVATPSQALWCGAADFNGDGKLDLAVSAYPSGVYMLFGKGNGTFKQPVVLGNTGWGYLAVGDVTRSAVPDIVLPAAAGASTAVVYINNGKGTFGTPVDVTLTGASVAIGDVNGDGLPDLVSGEGCVALGLGLARFATQVCYPVANNPETLSVVLAELNKGKAGFNDVITGLNHTVSVLINWGNGKFVDGLWIPVAGSGNCAASADFNADGKPDLGVPSTNGIAVLLGTGKALQPYSAGLTVPLSGPGCPITGDVNGDGIADILEGANSLGGVGVYLGKGDGTFVLASVIPFGSSTDMALGDFNHDGKPDVATSSNQMALGNGDGTFQPPTSILADPPNLGFAWIAAGDLNNDGWTDLMATQPSYCCGAVYVLLNNQQGGFTLTTIADSDAPTSIMLADLNGDGNLDAVAAEDGLAVAQVYMGDGKGGFVPGQNNIHYPFADELPAQIADVNGDGVLDLLLPANGSIGIALGMGNGTFYAPFVVGAGPDLGQVFAQSLHGQSSGFPDLVAPDSSGGVTVLLNLTQ